MTQVTSQETRRTVRTFGWASFLHDTGADMIYSVWPLFLTQVLGANKTAVGLIDGLGDTVVSVSGAVSGYLSDRIRKRKVFVWMGYGFGTVARIGYALAPTWLLIIPFRILDRSGKIRSSPRDAIVSDLSTHENRGSHFGFMRAMDNMGALVGITLSLILIRFLPLRTIFLLAAIPSVAAALLVFFSIKEKGMHSGTLFRGIRFGDVSPNLRLYTLASALLELGAFSYSFLLLAANTLGFATGEVPLLYLLFTLVATIVSVPAGRLADRFGRKPLLYASILSWIAVGVIFLVFRHPLILISAFAFYGLHKGALDPVQKTFAAELAPKEYVASTLGGFQLMIGMMSLPSSLIAGVLWDRYGLQAPFLFAIILTTLAFLLLLFVKEQE
ncbi:MAG: MFS transporter [Candidatus Peribacteraceae bacterium]|jgi:MFS family permease